MYEIIITSSHSQGWKWVKMLIKLIHSIALSVKHQCSYCQSFWSFTSSAHVTALLLVLILCKDHHDTFF